MKDEAKPKLGVLEQSEEDRIKQVRERIKNSKYFINRTRPGRGIAIIGGELHRKNAEEQ